MINSMNDLENILDSLIFEDPIAENIFDDHVHALELIESALYLMEDYMNENPTAISEPDFEEEFLEDIKEIFYIQFEEEILENDWIEDDLNELLEEAFKIFIGSFYPERSTSFTFKTDDTENNETNETNAANIISNSERIKQILDKIEHIKQKPQPTQRTDDWYKFRHNLITASNAYKAFESQCSINQLIYEKCQPLKSSESDKNTMVNINTPFHWGQKYEPLSVMLYEHLYNTKVADFGCIKHESFDFLGASPDGINIDTESTRFGRMLEIKNIVNREINGIPKKEYWIQMQLQMEVCDLDECDFLETKFVEYQMASEFFKEIEIELEQSQQLEQPQQDKNKNMPVLDKKGVILYFHNILEVKPFYIYKPLNIVKMDEILQWEEEMIGLYQSPEYNMNYIKSIYWKLEKLSCVLVLRNKSWFKNNIQSLENVWKIIEKERITGYEHRAPNRKNKIKNEYIDTKNGICLIKLDK